MSWTLSWLILFGLILWMTVKTARVSGGLAILVFLFWPAALIAVVKHWGNPDADIRIPFVLALVAAVFAMQAGNKAVDDFAMQAAPYMTDADIEEIRRSNPQMADRILAARAAMDEDCPEGDCWEDEDWQDEAYEAPAPVSRALPAARSAQTPTRKSAPVAGLAPEDQPRSAPAVLREPEDPSLQTIASRLSYRLGRIELGASGAELSLPTEFRFVARSGLPLVARLRGVNLDEETLGWIVHRDVDVADPDGWFIEARYRPVEQLQLAPLAYANRVGPADYVVRAMGLSERPAGEGPLGRTWNDGSLTATLSVGGSAAAEDLLDAYAIKPSARGAVVFLMRGSDPTRHELGLRATRLMAARTRVAEPAPQVPAGEAAPPAFVVTWLESGAGKWSALPMGE